MRAYLTLFGRALVGFGQDRCMSFAAAISYFALFSIFPLLLFVVSFLGFFVHSPAQREHMVTAVVAVLGPGIGRTALTAGVNAFAGGHGGIGAFGLVVAIWSASAVFGAIRTGLNAAWDVTQPGPIVPRKLRDLATVMAIGCLMLVSLALTGFLTALEGFGPHLLGHPIDHLTQKLSTLLAFAGPPAISFVAFALMYYLIPQAKIQLRDVWLGALAAAILFQAAQLAFGVYVGHFAHYDRLYGSLGAVIAFLFFMYISANILLLGGEITRQYADQRLNADADDQPALPGMQPPLPSRLVGMLKGLFVSR